MLHALLTSQVTFQDAMMLLETCLVKIKAPGPKEHISVLLAHLCAWGNVAACAGAC